MVRVLERQGYHLLAYVVGALLLWLAVRATPEAGRTVWGLPVAQWVAVSWLSAGLFQGSALLFWRAELHFGAVSSLFGRRAFTVHRISFVTLGTARFLPLVPIALGTARTSPLPPWLSLGLILVTTPAILWTLYSVFVYFGLNRAFGADHFDPAYRTRGLETRGIFRHVANPMYAVALLALYHPALLWQSGLGLLVAAIHHAFVWCHYFCTEKPDLREIYGRP